MALYLPQTFYSEERNYVPQTKTDLKRKRQCPHCIKEDLASCPSSGSGSGGVRHVVQTRRCQRNQPDSSSPSRGHSTCLCLTAVICQTLDFTADLFPPPRLPRFLLSPPSGRNVSTHFSLFMLCAPQTVGERSLRWCCAGERPVMFENRRCLATVKSTSVWTFKESVQSARMYAQVCFGNYLFKLFKEIYVKASISVFCLEISVVWNVRFKPQLQANSPKPLLFFKVSNQDWCDSSAKASLLTRTTVCQENTFTLKCSFKNRGVEVETCLFLF